MRGAEPARTRYRLCRFVVIYASTMAESNEIIHVVFQLTARCVAVVAFKVRRGDNEREAAGVPSFGGVAGNFFATEECSCVSSHQPVRTPKKDEKGEKSGRI